MAQNQLIGEKISTLRELKRIIPDIYTGNLVEWRHFTEAASIYLVDEG